MLATLWCAGTAWAEESAGGDGSTSVSTTSLPTNPEKLTPAQAVDAYLAVLLDETQTRIKRNYAAGQIMQLGKAASPAMVERYKRATAQERGYLAAVLGAMGSDPEAEKVLLADLKERGLGVHPNVILALGKMGSSEARPVLMEMLSQERQREDERVGLRLAIVQGLGGVADETSSGVLKEGLDDKDRLVRSACANGLAGLLVRLKAKTGPGTSPVEMTSAQRTAAIGAYEGVLKDVLEYCQEGKNEDARLILIDGLGTLREVKAVAVLGTVLEKGTPGLRSSAADALGLVLKQATTDLGLTPAETVERLDAEGMVDDLSEMVGDEDTAMSRAALRGLVTIGDARCVGPLIEELGKATGREHADRRRDMAKGLASLTGQNFGDNAEAWRNWWVSQPH